LEKIRPQFYWDTVVEPIDRMINRLVLEPKSKLTWKEFGIIIQALSKRKFSLKKALKFAANCLIPKSFLRSRSQ
jgi:hypothetical protein